MDRDEGASAGRTSVDRATGGVAVFVTALVVDAVIIAACGVKALTRNVGLGTAPVLSDAERHERYTDNITIAAVALALLSVVAVALFATRHRASGGAQVVLVVISALVLITVIGNEPARRDAPPAPRATVAYAAGVESSFGDDPLSRRSTGEGNPAGSGRTAAGR